MGGWQQGQLAPGRQCKGAPKQCRTCSNKIQFVNHILVNFFFFMLYFPLLFCFAFYASDTNFRLMHNYLIWLLRSLLARSPLLFDLKVLIEDGNLRLYMYCVYAQK